MFASASQDLVYPRHDLSVAGLVIANDITNVADDDITRCARIVVVVARTVVVRSFIIRTVVVK